MIVIQQGDSLALIGQLKENGVVVDISDAIITIDILKGSNIAIRATNSTDTDHTSWHKVPLIVDYASNSIAALFEPPITSVLAGSLKLILKVTWGGSNATSTNHLDIIINRNVCGATR